MGVWVLLLGFVGCWSGFLFALMWFVVFCGDWCWDDLLFGWFDLGVFPIGLGCLWLHRF